MQRELLHFRAQHEAELLFSKEIEMSSGNQGGQGNQGSDHEGGQNKIRGGTCEQPADTGRQGHKIDKR